MSGDVESREPAPQNSSARNGGGDQAAFAARWLCLAATPAFASMALLSRVFEGGGTDMLCAAAHGGSPLNGMATMYLLMSIFHAAPWLPLVSRAGRAVSGRQQKPKTEEIA